jgi:hypothetical protein
MESETGSNIGNVLLLSTSAFYGAKYVRIVGCEHGIFALRNFPQWAKA